MPPPPPPLVFQPHLLIIIAQSLNYAVKGRARVMGRRKEEVFLIPTTSRAPAPFGHACDPNRDDWRRISISWCTLSHPPPTPTPGPTEEM